MLRLCRYCGERFEAYPEANACPACVERRKHDVMRDRKCRTCNATFRGGPRAWYCPACRAERRRAADRQSKQRRAAGKARRIGSTARCEHCGQEYAVAGSLQRYCKLCADDLTRARKLELTRAWNAAHATPERRREERRAHAADIPCAVCGKAFVPRHSAVTCSPECAAELSRIRFRAWEGRNRQARRAYQVRRYRDLITALSPEQLRALRDKINARARENYLQRKNKEGLTMRIYDTETAREVAAVANAAQQALSAEKSAASDADEYLANRLGRLRRERGLTQQQLSNLSGVGLSTLQKLENGSNRLLGARTEIVLRLAKALGTTVEGITGG